ncbi:unnamed protein product [Durusdinium trenchii]
MAKKKHEMTAGQEGANKGPPKKKAKKEKERDAGVKMEVKEEKDQESEDIETALEKEIDKSSQGHGASKRPAPVVPTKRFRKKSSGLPQMAETAASANTEEKKEKTKGTTKSKNESTVVTEKFEDGWTVEIRHRLSGKAAGQCYKVFKDKSGTSHWTMKQAKEKGFKDPDGKVAAAQT